METMAARCDCGLHMLVPVVDVVVSGVVVVTVVPVVLVVVSGVVVVTVVPVVEVVVSGVVVVTVVPERRLMADWDCLYTCVRVTILIYL